MAELQNEDVTVLVLDYLMGQGLTKTAVALAQETNIDAIWTGGKSNEISFFRRLLFDGQYEDVISYLSPLEKDVDPATMQEVFHKVRRLQYLDLVMNGSVDDDTAIELKRILSCLKSLATEGEYSEYCYLLSVADLKQLPQFSGWTIERERLSCFKDVIPVLSPAVGIKRDGRLSNMEPNRLIALLERAEGLIVDPVDDPVAEKDDPLTSYPTASDILPEIRVPESAPEVLQKTELESPRIEPPIADSSSDSGDPPLSLDTTISVEPSHEVVEQIETPEPSPVKPFTEDLPASPIADDNDILESFIKFAVQAENKQNQAVRIASFDRTGNRLAVGTNSKSLIVFDIAQLLDSALDNVKTFSPILEKLDHHAGSVYCASWNSTSELIATGSNDKMVKIVGLQDDESKTIRFEKVLTGHHGTVRQVCFSPNPSSPSTLCSAGAGDYLVRVWDIESKFSDEALMVLDGHAGTVSAMEVSSDGQQLITGGMDKMVRLWDLRSGCCEKVITKCTSATHSLSFCPTDENIAASSHENGDCCLWDLRTGKQLSQHSIHRDECRSIQYSPDGKWLLTGSFDGTVCIAEVAENRSLRPVASFAQHRDKVLSAGWHPTIPAFVSTGADKMIKLWTNK